MFFDSRPFVIAVLYCYFIENFVGNSGLLGAHANGKWVTGFAENCHSVLKAFVVHVLFLRSHSETLAGALEQPDTAAYANMQRMTKEYSSCDYYAFLSSSGLSFELIIFVY